MIVALEIAVLALAPWPLYRLLSIPVFRRSFSCFAIRVVGILSAYAIAVTLIVLYSPALLHIAAALALVILTIERFRARSGFGASRNLPRGTLSLVPRGPWLDDEYFGKMACRYGPIFKISHYFRPMVCVIGPRRGLALLNAHEGSLKAPQVRFSRFIPRGFLRYMAPLDHDKYKKILQKTLSRSVLRNAEGRIGIVVQDGLAEMAADSTRKPDDGIEPRRYLSDMLLAVFVELFFGVKRNSETFGRLSELYQRIDIKKASCASPRLEMRAADQIAQIITEHIAYLKVLQEEGERLPPCFLAEFLRQSLAAELDRTILLNLVYILQAGRADMLGLLTWVLKLLCDNADWTPRIHDDLIAHQEGESKESGLLASRVIKESLRLEQSEFLFRESSKNIEFEDFLIPKGWFIRICIREGHRDAGIFSEPDKFIPDRFLVKTPTKEEYSPLGMLRHSCLGAQIVDTVGTIFVSELARRYGIVATRDGPREYGRAHWEPSSLFKIAISRTAAPAAAGATAI